MRTEILSPTKKVIELSSQDVMVAITYYLQEIEGGSYSREFEGLENVTVYVTQEVLNESN